MATLLSVNNYHYYRGGAETVFLEHNRLFEQAGWAVVPFAMRHPRNIPTRWDDYFADEIEFGDSYSLGEKLVRAPRVVYSFQARTRLDRLLSTARPDICHAHNIYHHISPSILGLLKKRGVPVVLTLHDLKIACPAYQMLTHDGICERCRGGRLYNVTLHRCIKGSTLLSSIVMVEAMLHRLVGSYTRCVSRFVVPSLFYARKLQEWGLPSSNFRHVPNFVDASRYVPQFQPGDRFLYFGRLSPEKGLRTFVQAAAVAKIKVAIAGTGNELEGLRRLVEQTGADVQFLGYLTGHSLHESVQRARAVVLPSEWYENAPMSVLEAYALGKPVIVAGIGGLPELIQDGITGYQFESGNVAELAHALNRIQVSEESTVAEMGREGRRWVENEFTAPLYRERILAVYRELGVDAQSVRSSNLGAT